MPNIRANIFEWIGRMEFVRMMSEDNDFAYFEMGTMVEGLSNIQPMKMSMIIKGNANVFQNNVHHNRSLCIMCPKSLLDARNKPE